MRLPTGRCALHVLFHLCFLVCYEIVTLDWLDLVLECSAWCNMDIAQVRLLRHFRYLLLHISNLPSLSRICCYDEGYRMCPSSCAGSFHVPYRSDLAFFYTVYGVHSMFVSFLHIFSTCGRFKECSHWVYWVSLVQTWNITLWQLRFSQQCLWRLLAHELWCHILTLLPMVRIHLFKEADSFETLLQTMFLYVTSGIHMMMREGRVTCCN
jgi:hypothetical protein